MTLSIGVPVKRNVVTNLAIFVAFWLRVVNTNGGQQVPIHAMRYHDAHMGPKWSEKNQNYCNVTGHGTTIHLCEPLMKSTASKVTSSFYSPSGR